MGVREPGSPDSGETPLGYHPRNIEVLTHRPEAGEGTVSGGQFDWGGRLPKSNGGAQRSAQDGWKSSVACKGKSRLDCETDRSSRCESRAK